MRLSAFACAMFVTAMVLAACQPSQQDADLSPEERFAQLGERVYLQRCSTCHQPSGRGVPGAYPTLHGTAWVNGDKGRLIRLVLDGARGPMEVEGEVYDNIMTAHHRLTDDQIAAVLTYVRSHFGNDTTAVTPDEVSRVRLADEHEGYWDPDELWEATGLGPGAE